VILKNYKETASVGSNFNRKARVTKRMQVQQLSFDIKIDVAKFDERFEKPCGGQLAEMLHSHSVIKEVLVNVILF